MHNFTELQKASSRPVDALVNPLSATRENLGHLPNLLLYDTTRTLKSAETLDRFITIAVAMETLNQELVVEGELLVGTNEGEDV